MTIVMRNGCDLKDLIKQQTRLGTHSLRPYKSLGCFCSLVTCANAWVKLQEYIAQTVCFTQRIIKINGDFVLIHSPSTTSRCMDLGLYISCR